MQIFHVAGMSCGHCVKSVTQAVQALEPAAQVQVDLKLGEVRVSGESSRAQLIEAIRQAGYGVEAVAPA